MHMWTGGLPRRVGTAHKERTDAEEWRGEAHKARTDAEGSGGVRRTQTRRRPEDPAAFKARMQEHMDRYESQFLPRSQQKVSTRRMREMDAGPPPLLPPPPPPRPEDARSTSPSLCADVLAFQQEAASGSLQTQAPRDASPALSCIHSAHIARRCSRIFASSSEQLDRSMRRSA